MNNTNTGYTPTMPRTEQLTNLIASCKVFLERDPQNVYWLNQLQAAEKELDELNPPATDWGATSAEYKAAQPCQIIDGVSCPEWFENQPEVKF